MSVARRVLHLRPAIAWCGVLLSLAFAGSAGAADRIEIDIQGVDREIANNVRGFLTLARYTGLRVALLCAKPTSATWLRALNRPLIDRAPTGMQAPQPPARCLRMRRLRARQC